MRCLFEYNSGNNQNKYNEKIDLSILNIQVD